MKLTDGNERNGFLNKHSHGAMDWWEDLSGNETIKLMK